MAKTDATAKTNPSVVSPALPEVDARSVTVNADGFAWREVLVRLPAGMTADDLRSPKVWRKVQGNPQFALRRLDHLFVLSHDESWMVRAVVTYADSTEAMLAIEKVSTFREIGKALYSDGTYRVAWTGGSFVIERVSDGVQVDGSGYTTEAAAVAAIARQYPTKVA